MQKMVINGGNKLNGEVATGGAKNAALPILFSTLLADGEHIFHNVPDLMDIKSTRDLLESFGCETSFNENTLKIVVKPLKTFEAHYDLVRKMRASILCLGPLLARHKQARVSLPGGCAIGSRPIDYHLNAIEQLGAESEVTSGYVVSKTSGLRGTQIIFDMPSVGATENVLMAAVLAEGTTTIENAAKEPEIVDLAAYLVKMGAKISGAGTGIITIEGVKSLSPSEHHIIADRIEAGTLLIAGAITGGSVKVTNCNPKDIEALISKMRESGFSIEVGENFVSVNETNSWKAVDVTTTPHPGFPTDLQAQFMALMTQAQGSSIVTETIFENRFMHVQELLRLNADISMKARVCVVRGNKNQLTGAPVMATDLRASACLILAGLVAKGETVVNRIYHLDRGYEKLENKLTKLGASIKRIE